MQVQLKLIQMIWKYVPLPYYKNQQFIKSAFNDMRFYIQNNTFNQHFDEEQYQLPLPLLLDNQDDFYDLEQLTYDEISLIFIKHVESLNDNNMERMNNLFKLADFLQMERLVTIIGARQPSSMINMNKQEMIDWLMDSHNTKTQMATDNNNNDNNLKMISLLLAETQSKDDNDNEECTINDTMMHHS